MLVASRKRQGSLRSIVLPPCPIYFDRPEGVGVDLIFGPLEHRRLHVPPQPHAMKVFMRGVPFVFATFLEIDNGEYVTTNLDIWGVGGALVETPQFGPQHELDFLLSDDSIPLPLPLADPVPLERARSEMTTGIPSPAANEAMYQLKRHRRRRGRSV